MHAELAYNHVDGSGCVMVCGSTRLRVFVNLPSGNKKVRKAMSTPSATNQCGHSSEDNSCKKRTKNYS